MSFSMKIQTAVTSLIFLTASALSMASSAISFGDKSAAPALVGGSLGLIVVGLIVAVAFRSWNNRPGRRS